MIAGRSGTKRYAGRAGSPDKKRRDAMVMAAISIAACLVSCSAPKARADLGVSHLGEMEVSPERLSADLVTFSHYFAATVAGLGSTIAANTKDRAVREMTLLLKTRTIPVVYSACAGDDPRRDFLAAWAICARIRYYVTEGEGKDFFADQQELAIAAFRRLEEQIVAIGERNFARELIEKAKPEIDKVAREVPVLARFALAPPDVTPAGPSATNQVFSSFLLAPLSPFQGLQGVSDTPGAINNFAMSARTLAEIVRLLPERVRWQSELLILELESLESVTKAREGVERASLSMESLAATARTLPADLRKELDIALESSQGDIRKTLEEAKSTVAAVREGLTDLERAAAEVSGTTAKAEAAGRAWEETAKAVGAAVAAIKDLAEPEPGAKPDPNAKPFDPDDYGRAAAEIRQAAIEVRGLLADIASGKVEAGVSGVGATAAATVDRAGEQIAAAVDRIALWTLGLVVLVAALFTLRGRLGRRPALAAAGPSDRGTPPASPAA